MENNENVSEYSSSVSTPPHAESYTELDNASDEPGLGIKRGISPPFQHASPLNAPPDSAVGSLHTRYRCPITHHPHTPLYVPMVTSTPGTGRPAHSVSRPTAAHLSGYDYYDPPYKFVRMPDLLGPPMVNEERQEVPSDQGFMTMGHFLQKGQITQVANFTHPAFYNTAMHQPQLTFIPPMLLEGGSAATTTTAPGAPRLPARLAHSPGAGPIIPKVSKKGRGPIMLGPNEREQAVTIPIDFVAPPSGSLDQLDFNTDLCELGRSYWYFLTVGDRLKASARGFLDAEHVYAERLHRPNIETTDINLAWIPGLTHKNGALPWKPICGTAAYVAAVNGDLKVEFTPGEILYVGGQRYEADALMPIPMLLHSQQSLWHRKEHARAQYAYPRTYSDKHDYMSFVPSQAEWGPSNLPPSAALLEPIKAGKSLVPELVDRNGIVIRDAYGEPRRAFDHVLPARVSSRPDGWLLAAWIAEDPRLQWRDIEAHMKPTDDAARFNDWYQKYRDSLPAMTRTTSTSSKRAPTKTDVKTVTGHGHKQLAGNSFWFVDLAKELMCQTVPPTVALTTGLPVFDLIRKEKKEAKPYSRRVCDALDAKMQQRRTSVV